MKKKTISLIAIITLLSYANPIPNVFFARAEEEIVDIEKLDDLKRNHWAYSAIELIVQELGVMTPKTPKKFLGDDTTIRYEVADAFLRAAIKLEAISGLDLKAKGKKKKLTITDVEPQYKELIDDVVNDYGLMQVLPVNKFFGKKAITRYELAYELNNYMDLLEQVVNKKTKPEINRMEKLSDIKAGHWATNSVKNIINKYQFMKGYPDNKFKGSNTLTRYELVSVLKKFIDYIDKYLIPIPKAVPTPMPTPIPTPLPTPLPTVVPIPVRVLPTPTPMPTPTPDFRTPLRMVDVRGGLLVKASTSGTSTNNEIDTLIGPFGKLNVWFPKFNNERLGVGINTYLLSYGQILNQYHNVSNLKRSTVGVDANWRVLGADYEDDTSVSVGVGYGLVQWSGANYTYSTSGPKTRILFEYPIVPYLSLIGDEQFQFMISKDNRFAEQLAWTNELFLGVNVMALSQFSVQIGYMDTRFSLGKADIYGDVGLIALGRFRY